MVAGAVVQQSASIEDQGEVPTTQIKDSWSLSHVESVIEENIPPEQRVDDFSQQGPQNTAKRNKENTRPNTTISKNRRRHLMPDKEGNL